MVLFATWSHSESFGPGSSTISPHPPALDILGVKIQQREGEVASAQLIVPRETPIHSDFWITLWHNPQNVVGDVSSKSAIPLFYGRCVGIPSVLDEYIKKIEYLAIPIDVDAQHNLLIQHLKEQGHVDERFICPHHRHNPAEYLEATPNLFCYHRVTHKVILSNLFEGREVRHLKDQILSGGLVLKLVDNPLSAIKLRISQEWVQEAQGEINLMPCIESRFPQGFINTLTPQSLLSTWPQTGQILGRSGYAVERSSLRMIQPNVLGGNGIYPTLTLPIQGHRFQRAWLGGELVVSWHYRQKRREILMMEIQQVTQLPSMQVKAPRTLNLKLRERKVLSSGSFFETSEGKSAIGHGIKIAQCHLAYSSRAVEVSVEIPFEEGIQLHLDQSIEVVHDCLPGGRVRGKIVSYILERGGTKALATLKIALSVGVGPLNEKEDVLNELEMEKPDGINAPEMLNGKDFLEDLIIQNTAEEQLLYLSKAKDPTQLPQEGVTRIGIGLKDLRTHDVLERSIRGPVIQWSAPRQMG